MKVPGLRGNASFVEATGGTGPRVIDRRRAYYRFENQWHKSDRISQEKGCASTWHIIEDGSVFRFESRLPTNYQHAAIATNGNDVLTLTNQADAPVLGTLKLEDAQATSLGSQLVVPIHVPGEDEFQPVVILSGGPGFATLRPSMDGNPTEEVTAERPAFTPWFLTQVPSLRLQSGMWKRFSKSSIQRADPRPISPSVWWPFNSGRTPGSLMPGRSSATGPARRTAAGTRLGSLRRTRT